MEKQKLYIYGIGRLADYVAYVFEYDSEYKVEGFCMEQDYIENNPEQCGKCKVFEDMEDVFLKDKCSLFIAVGNNVIREKIFKTARRKGITLATYISTRSSTWPNMEIGINCFIGEGSVIQPFVQIGDNSILFGARLGHHTTLGNHVLLSGPTIGGNVKIGDLTFIGLNAVVLQNLEIGAKNIIGMGVSIKNSTGEGEVYSSPVSTKRKVKFDDISRNYLN